jgi:hypothetical protein
VENGDIPILNSTTTPSRAGHSDIRLNKSAAALRHWVRENFNHAVWGVEIWDVLKVVMDIIRSSVMISKEHHTRKESDAQREYPLIKGIDSRSEKGDIV